MDRERQPLPHDDSGDEDGPVRAVRASSTRAAAPEQEVLSERKLEKLMQRRRSSALRRRVSETDKVRKPPQCFRLREVTLEVVQELAEELADYGHSPKQLRWIVMPRDLRAVLGRVQAVLEREANVVCVRQPVDAGAARVTVVGDTHGQFFDLYALLRRSGWPSREHVFIFNGDFVDRGAWGVETALVVLLLKLALPDCVFLTRGNHESASTCEAYGFKSECLYKYDAAVYAAFLNAFKALPLAALVLPAEAEAEGAGAGGGGGGALPARHGCGAFVVHGGLAVSRSGPWPARLEEVMGLDRHSIDPEDALVLDLTWSDPHVDRGLQRNFVRGVGHAFGADCTLRFLRENGLSLVVRSHEGPDAREKRAFMPAKMMEGHAWDHRDAHGTPLLVTVFSAPDYPQGAEHRGNLGAVLHLTFHRLSADEKAAEEARRRAQEEEEEEEERERREEAERRAGSEEWSDEEFVPPKLVLERRGDVRLEAKFELFAASAHPALSPFIYQNEFAAAAHAEPEEEEEEEEGDRL